MRMLSLCFLMIAGCSNGGGGTPDAASDARAEAGPVMCSSDPDCPLASDSCWFPVDGQCTLKGMMGQCVTYIPMSGCTPTVACGCDGTTISVCGPPGLVNRPSNMAGACPFIDAGTDAAADSGDASPE